MNIFKAAVAAPLIIALSMLLSGCSGEKPPADGADAKASISYIKKALKKAARPGDAAVRTELLCKACTLAEQLKSDQPDDPRAVAFLAENAEALDRIPGRVYVLAMETGNLAAFRWAMERGVPVNIEYPELLKFWELGPDWRDYILAGHPDEALPVFMNRAIETYSVRFFNRYVDAFKALGYRVEPPQEPTEFNVRFCRFIAEQIDLAIAKKDRERIAFLIEHTPRLADVVYIDWKMKESMRALGDYVFQTLEDESLACQLVELGYGLNRVDLAKVGFSTNFTALLRADPDYAVEVLRLNEWQGRLSEQTAEFALTLPAESLKGMHKLYLGELIQFALKADDSEGAMRLVGLREERAPLTRSDYTELLNWSLRYANKTLFSYVLEHCKDIDVFSIDFAALANSQKLFEQYAPLIMNNVYFTMDTNPRDDGTTLGRICQVFASRNEAAGLFLVQKYDLAKAWVNATEGRTLLMDVCEAGNLSAARFLIENRGADIRAETGYSELQISIFGRTRPTEGKLSPIFFAAKSGNVELIRYLVSKGADVNARSNYGTTPLMHAVSAGHLDAVKALIAMRANVHAQMSARVSAADMSAMGLIEEISNAYRRAENLGNQEILEVLKKAGARR